MKKPNKEDDYYSKTIYPNLKLFAKDKYIKDLEAYCEYLEQKDAKDKKEDTKKG